MFSKQTCENSATESGKIVDLKTAMFKRPVPTEYAKLIENKKFMRSPQAFSDYLGEVISTQKLFSEDRFGHKFFKEVSEVKKNLNGASLTEFGKALKSVVTGRDFIDLASGKPTSSPLPRIVAETFGAKRYFGIDSQLDKDEIKIDESGENKVFDTVYIKDDVLSFISRLDTMENGLLFYISGLEPVSLVDPNRRAEIQDRNPRMLEEDRVARAYIDACLKEISRITKVGDVIVIGQGTRGFEPQNYGFQLKAQMNYHFLYEKM